MPQISPEVFERARRRVEAQRASAQARAGSKEKEDFSRKLSTTEIASTVAKEAVAAAGLGALFGGPTGALAGGAGALGARAIFGLPETEEDISQANAGVAAQVGSAVGSRFGAPGRAIGGTAGATLQQLIEGKTPQQAAQEGVLQGAVPEGITQLGGQTARLTRQIRRRMRNLISPNKAELSEQFSRHLNESDPRFGVPNVKEPEGVVEFPVSSEHRKTLLPGPGATKAVKVGVKELDRFQRIAASDAPNSARAAVLLESDPIKLAAMKSTLSTPARKRVEAAWVAERLLPGTRRVEQGDLPRIVEDFGMRRLKAVLGPNADNAVDSLNKQIELVGAPTTLGQRLRSFIQYTENRFTFDLARTALIGGVSGGAAATLQSLGLGQATVFIGIPAGLAAFALSDTAGRLMTDAVRGASREGVQQALRVLIQESGYRFVPVEQEDGSLSLNTFELVPPQDEEPSPVMTRPSLGGPPAIDLQQLRRQIETRGRGI